MDRQLFDAVQQKLTDQWSHRLRSSPIGFRPIASGISTMRRGSCWIVRREGNRYGNVGAADQLRPEADRIDARNSLGAGMGPALAAGNGDVRWVCLEWPDL